jgi:hypothetical protein
MQALKTSVARLLLLLTAIETLSWLFDEDAVVHAWVRAHRFYTCWALIAFVLFGWIVYDSQAMAERRRVLSAAKRRRK